MYRGCEVFLSTDVVTGDLVVRVIGEVDAATVAVLEDALESVLPHESPVLVIDLANVDFMSAAGLRLLIDTNDRLRRAGRSLSLRHPSSGVSMVLRAAGVEHLFDIERRNGTQSPGR